jgi:hypothetical protein
MSVDVSELVEELFPALNATAAADLLFWTETELYQWADEAVKRLARKAAVFVERTQDTDAPANSAHNLDERDLAVIECGWNGAALSPATVRELEALDENWEEADAGTPAKYATDFLGLGQVRLYPPPSAAGVLDLITLQVPEEITSAAAELRAPEPVKEILRLRMLQEARGREGDGAMPEVAERLGKLADVLELVAVRIWGASH